MPTRPYSAAIVGGLWPLTSADSWSDVSGAQRTKAIADADSAADIRRRADGLYNENAGKAIDGMHGMYMRDAMAIGDQADMYQTMSEVVDEVAQLVYHARSRLDAIDLEANQKIEELKQSLAAGGLMASASAGLAAGQIMAIIAEARGRAEAVSSSVVAEIMSQGRRIGVPSDSMGGVPIQLTGFGGGGGGNPRMGGMPQSFGPLQESPALDRTLEVEPISNESPIDRPTDDSIDPSEVDQPSDTGSNQGTLDDLSKDVNSPIDRPLEGGAPKLADDPRLGEATNPLASAPSGMFPGMSSPSSSGAGGMGLSSGMGGSGGFSSSGIGGGGGLTSSAPSTSSMGSAGLGGPASGLTSSAGAGVGGGGASATPAGNDFGRGLQAGLNASANSGGGSFLPPPAAPPPPTHSASTTGAPSTQAAVSPAMGGANVAAPTPISSSGGAPVGGPIGAPMMAPPAGGAAAGPLPPFTSDLPRNSPPVAPAAGSASPVAPAASPPPTAAPGMAPLPPGVIASGVGAAAAGAGAGLRSTLPDPLLESASRLVYELMHASRLYAAIDWCVGVFKTPSGVQTVVVSSEGAGYIPSGVFLPRSARTLFSDPSLSDAFRARWFSWVNPAMTMLGYAAACGEHDPNIELYAVAVSTDHGGSAVPARDAGVPHYEDCSLRVSPIAADAAAPTFDGTRMHRLETLDRAEYARLTRSGELAPDRKEAWSITENAVRVALSRASSLLGFSVPPVIRQVATALGSGEAARDTQWNDLELARLNATLDSASQRPGRLADNVPATPHARAFHNLARVAELLALWRGGDRPHAEIAYVAAQITTEARIWPVGTE
ncbi:chemotaxis protein [Mycobacterium sp. 236(2023)]|uniref:chemotaxis protein n=1 Tax=Mycobacterium sp. 236(2023) TaxID=3038163 RepID=UPI0024150631|nr:chemotaxis protein [Mycobacterium sp. 236(2023)]MDG4667970.1 chemotaxis protein [Mycobacterium sp. 236(2023)]